jgi:hypothetical protein
MRLRLMLAAVAVLFVGALTVTPASAQYVGGTPPDAGSVVSPGPGAEARQGGGVAVSVDTGRRVQTTGFALTGADIAQLVLIGGVLVVGGALLVRQSRRRVVPSAS